jgi:hypothetical protein
VLKLNYSPVKIGGHTHRVCFLNGHCVQQIRYTHNNVKEGWNRTGILWSTKTRYKMKLTGSYQVVLKPEEDRERSGGTIVCRDLFSFWNSIAQREDLSLSLSLFPSLISNPLWSLSSLILSVDRSRIYPPLFFLVCHLRSASTCFALYFEEQNQHFKGFPPLVLFPRYH